MTKRTTTRPTPLHDIRYFESEGRVDEGAAHHYTDTLFHVPKEAKARADRLATLCYRARVSITRSSLYLCFTPALPEGTVMPTTFQSAVWQRYVMYGLPVSFNELDEASRIERIWLATLECLRTIAPAEQIGMIEDAARIVESAGEALQFPLASTKNRQYLAETASDMPTWPRKARLSLTVTDRSSLATATCVLFESKLSNECGFLGGKVRIVDGQVMVSPKASSWGAYYAKRNNLSSFLVSIESLFQGAPTIVRNPFDAGDA